MDEAIRVAEQYPAKLGHQVSRSLIHTHTE